MIPAKHINLVALVLSILSLSAYADETHGSGSHHAFVLEAGISAKDDGSHGADWDFDGWIGTDENKLWLKSEGERSDSETEQAEFWTLYSRNVAAFWDLQAGIRHDTKPHSLTQAVVGFNGLAPYFFETEAHLFLSEDGDVSARIKQEKELLFTQRLISELYYELDIFLQDVSELDIGAGLASAELGVQTRYEITRTFAPYLEIKYERKLGETSAIAKDNGEDSSAIIGIAGLRLLF